MAGSCALPRPCWLWQQVCSFLTWIIDCDGCVSPPYACRSHKPSSLWGTANMRYFSSSHIFSRLLSFHLCVCKGGSASIACGCVPFLLAFVAVVEISDLGLQLLFFCPYSISVTCFWKTTSCSPIRKMSTAVPDTCPIYPANSSISTSVLERAFSIRKISTQLRCTRCCLGRVDGDACGAWGATYATQWPGFGVPTETEWDLKAWFPLFHFPLLFWE